MSFDQTKPVANSTLASSDIRNNFQHIKNAISNEHNWNDADTNGTTHNLDAMNITVTGSTQGSIGTGGSISGSLSGSAVVLNQITGVSGGAYSLQNLIQQLVNRSHVHGTSGIAVNCNCCNCCGP